MFLNCFHVGFITNPVIIIRFYKEILAKKIQFNLFLLIDLLFEH